MLWLPFTLYIAFAGMQVSVAQEVPDGRGIGTPPVQSTGTVDLRHAVERAIVQHPSLLSARGRHESSLENIDVARSQYYPQVSGGLGSDYNRYRNGRYDESYLHSINLNVTQVVYDFGKISSAVDKAQYAAGAALAQAGLTTEQVAREASRAVIEAVRYSRLSELAAEQAEQVERITELVQHRAQMGASTQSDVLQARSRLDAIQAQRVVLETQHEGWLRDLTLILGYETVITQAQVGDPPAGLQQVCTSPVDTESSPEVQIAKMNELQAAADLELSEAQSLPTLQIQAQASRPLNASPAYGSPYETSINLNFSMPFYQGGGLSASKRAAAGALRAARAETSHVRLRLQQQMADLSSRHRGMQGRAAMLEDRVRNIHGTKDLYRRQYVDLGTRSLLDLLNAEQEHHQARVELANNELDLLQAQVDCAFHQGMLARTFGVAAPG